MSSFGYIVGPVLASKFYATWGPWLIDQFNLENYLIQFSEPLRIRWKCVLYPTCACCMSDIYMIIIKVFFPIVHLMKNSMLNVSLLKFG